MDDAFLKGLPKAELHLHIEGSLEPEQMFEFARRNRVSIPFASVEEVRAAYSFGNLQDFLDIYYRGADVLRTERDFHDLALAYFRRAAADGVRHAEIFFDPQTHTARGIPFQVVADGLIAGMAAAEARLGLTSKLILCFLRHLDEEDAFATLKAAEPWLDQIAGVGLDSSEIGHPPAKFMRVFAAAGAAGLKRVAHAGEEGPPLYVREALDLLEIDRLDHGNRSLEDDALVTRLAREAMTLTVCPLSNHKLRVVDDLARHPIAAMLGQGLRATINSDDPAYFGGYVVDNYRAVAPLLTREQIVALARNSFLGSFLSDAAVGGHLAGIDAFVAAGQERRTWPNPPLVPVSHDQLVADVEAIAIALEASGWRPDHIVGIGRGGLVPGAYLSHRTGISLLSVDHSSGVPGFAGELLAKLAAQTRGGARILLIDDINDSGGTIEALRGAILEAGGEAAHLRVAVLIDNRRSPARVDYRGRTIDRTTDKSWFVFPWEAMAPRAALIEDAGEVPLRLA